MRCPGAGARLLGPAAPRHWPASGCGVPPAGLASQASVASAGGPHGQNQDVDSESSQSPSALRAWARLSLASGSSTASRAAGLESRRVSAPPPRRVVIRRHLPLGCQPEWQSAGGIGRRHWHGRPTTSGGYRVSKMHFISIKNTSLICLTWELAAFAKSTSSND